MSDAINYIYLVFNSFINFIFNEMVIIGNVYFGWVILSLIVLGILVRNLLALPNKSQSINVKSKEDN